jgi:hypothetical protein
MRSSKRIHHADAADEPLPLAYPPGALSPPQQPDLVAASRALLNGLSREEVRARTRARRCATCMRTRACVCVCAPIHSTQAITSVLRRARARARACAGVCGFLLCRVVGRVLVV